ncbi:Acyl-CoA reductase (LuxC) [Fodinibius salinus]|uniref:Acyl-CoA reductase (LuxC) n=1 Tax=Fodinibius salinus TaxID=860790 RepID=A0A5D3YLZ8_9BACT|nr:acyl-CoA reductase [Fodinibius salinus]TYP94974.1 Acyl-CoA reductase (LuxC) [Fodinibius salinus]
MEELKLRINTLLKATENWLNGDNHYLMDAIDRTVREGYFSFEDTQYAIRAIKEGITKSRIEEWCERAEINDGTDASGQNVLCLHAGNLPLVGFQDAFATLLSGARYTGKISKKDPYLLPTFLNEVKKTELWTDMDVQWTHRLDDFEGMRHDAILFAGSESSVPSVKKAIEEYNLAKQDGRYLIRTAHFSIAYLDQKDDQTMQDLAEAILRYGGKGCRSAAIVVSPYGLDEMKSDLVDFARSFWQENPQHLEPSPKLRQQYAYNEAVGRTQCWFDYFLVQEDGLELDQDFVCYWVQGDEQTVADLAEMYGQQLQSIYVTQSDNKIPDWQERTELLANAQQPPIHWQPDSVDTLAWLKD